MINDDSDIDIEGNVRGDVTKPYKPHQWHVPLHEGAEQGRDERGNNTNSHTQTGNKGKAR